MFGTEIKVVEPDTVVWLKNGGKLHSATVTETEFVVCERTNTIYVTQTMFDKMKEASKK